MTTTAPPRTQRGSRPGRPSAPWATEHHRRRAGGLGALLTLLCLIGAAGLARSAVAAWPGGDRVDPAAALLPVALGAAALLLGWVGWVLGRATVALVPLGRAGHRGETGALAETRAAVGTGAATAAGGRPAAPAAVRAATALLVGLTGLGAGVSAQAAPPPGAPVVTGAQLATAALATAHPGPAAPAGPLHADPGQLPADARSDAGSAAGPDAGSAALAGTPSERPADAPDRAPDPDVPAIPQPGWTPTRPAAVAPRDVGLVSTVPHETLPETVVVRRGDTLWDLAARHLGAGASTTDIAEEWPRWYAANRAAIGPDPDLIRPGQELVVPAGEADR